MGTRIGVYRYLRCLLSELVGLMTPVGKAHQLGFEQERNTDSAPNGT